MDGQRQLIPRDNSGHIVPAVLEGARRSLVELAGDYFQTEVAGQAEATIEAKRHDLQRFLDFFHQLYGHYDPAEWYRSVTDAYMKDLARAKPKPAQLTLRRRFTSLRHFARWVERVQPFPRGCPTDGVRAPDEPESEWKGLSRADELRLLAAAETLRVRPGRGTNNGARDLALVAVLLGCGLRVSELLALEVEQFDGKGFRNVLQKGGSIRGFVPVARTGRDALVEFLEERGRTSGPLFQSRSGERLSRKTFYEALQRIAKQANAHRPGADPIRVSPHVLRHTFLRKVAEQKGVHYAKEASGHKSDRYIWRYIKPDRETLAEAIDELD